MDIEKVIKQLESLRDICNAKSNMAIGKGKIALAGYANAADDAIAMLKKQQAVERTCRKGTNGFSIIWTCGACGSDLHPNNAKAKYCSNCGQAVKWE